MMENILLLGATTTSIVAIYKLFNFVKSHEYVSIARDFIFYQARNIALEYFQAGIVTDRPETGAIEIKYFLRDTPYTMIVAKKKGARPISKVLTTNNEDITESIKTLLGPYGNFHGIPTTPKMLGYPEGLNVVYRNPLVGDIFYEGLKVIGLFTAQ